MNAHKSKHNVNLEVFVNKEIDEIHKQAVGSSNEYKIIRQSCIFVKGIVSSYGQGVHAGTSNGGTCNALLPEEITVPLLSLLQTCLACKNERVIDPALSCLHKLIAYAYLQGETRPSGRLDDAENTVNTVVLMAARAASTPYSNSKVQLTAVKTLLTASTAEHFVPHGDCLMLAVRTAFNIAINGSTDDVKNASASALLQMMNTILKRIAHQIHTPFREKPLQVWESSHQACPNNDESMQPDEETEAGNNDEKINRDKSLQDAFDEICDDTDARLHDLPSLKLTHQRSSDLEMNIVTAADQRAAQLSQLAERSDVRGLEEAMTERASSPGLKALSEIKEESCKDQGFISIEEGRLMDQPDKSMDMPREGGNVSPHTPYRLRRVETPPDPRRALMKDSRAPEWKVLTVAERDIVIVFSAMCKMASRETGAGAAGTYFHSGKLLALNTMVKVLMDPMHDWDHIRPELAVHLRQPLCLAILRNCKSPYENAVMGSVKILCSMLSAPSLRSNLKAEIGALYPLVLLRPLETGEISSSAFAKHQAIAALGGLEYVCQHPQILVDIFVNFDCSLQASNLFERTVNNLCREAAIKTHSPDRWALAQKCLLKCIESLDTWTGPLKPWLSYDSESSSHLEDENEYKEKDKGHDILAKLHSDKAKKNCLHDGLAYFNDDPIHGMQYMIDSNVIDGRPESAATFLIDQSSVLDPEAIGELLGHHADRNIDIMHAYVRKFNFQRMSVDQALRLLLRGFRLPGEAQKIDRIMEKFAEKYCEDNPDAFPIADAAYLLAFAIIMLNTDAHNPMAEGRILAEDFVTMCTYQTETGDYDQILPRNELLELHRRILLEEIAVPESRKPKNFDGKKNKALRKLAAATGLSRLVAPFHAGNAWDKQHGAEQERIEMQNLSMEISTHKVVLPGRDEWRTATHAEHARPMLQVSGEAISKALLANLKSSNSIGEAMPLLKGYEQAIKLSALLWLENLTLTLVQGLGNAAGFGLFSEDFHVPLCAPAGSAQEARNVACLSRLVSLGSTREAGLLGGAWVVIFRILSGLEQLKKDLSPDTEEPRSITKFSMKWIPKPKNGREIHEKRKVSRKPTRTVMRQAQGPLTIREEPGMGLVIWAETSGASAIEKIFSSSIDLDGESILTFLRALCAISQEELEPTDGSPAKVYLLQRIVECAYFNSGRIRLVWQRLWTVVSQHLVFASCCPDTYVAMFAVDALRQLADKLLCRTELAGFASQGEAIRPLGSVLRCSDSVAVRELAIACIAHIVDSHHDRIVGGWWAVIDALGIAASDSSPQVLAHAIDIMRPVFKSLYRNTDNRSRHECIEECISAAIAAIANQSSGDDTAPAIAALELFQTLCQNLYDSKNEERFELQKWVDLLTPLAAIARSDPRPEVADTAATVLFFSLTTYGDCFDAETWEIVFKCIVIPMLSIYPTEKIEDLMGILKAGQVKISKTTSQSLASLVSPASPQALQTPFDASLRIIRQANNHLPGFWNYMAINPLACRLLVPFLCLLRSYSLSETDTIIESAELLCHTLVSALSTNIPPGLWKDVTNVLNDWLKLPSVEEDCTLEQLRRRCNSLIIGFHVIKWTIQHCQVEENFIEDIVDVMRGAIDRIRDLNDDPNIAVWLNSIMNKGMDTVLDDVGNDLGFADLANAVVETVRSTDDTVQPAFGKVEMVAEHSFLDSLISAAQRNSLDETIRNGLYSKALSTIKFLVERGCRIIGEMKNSRNTDVLWLQQSRVLLSADSLVRLAEIPQKYWSGQRNEMMLYASKMVKSQDPSVRKSISTFFQLVGKK